MLSSFHSIDASLSLVHQVVPMGVKPKVVDLPVHHLIIIDCSGSMYGELPLIRTQLKNKLPSLVKEDDSVSIIWFSSRGQYGTLVENLKVRSLTDFAQMNSAIDRWLKPVGLTGFKEPLLEAGAVIDRAAKANPTGLFSLFFMSDGYDNQWSQGEIVKAIESLQDRLNGAVFVEYGYYCNRPLMTKMAEAAGGSLLFSEDFPRYEPVFEAALSKRISGVKKIEVALDVVPEFGLVYALAGDELLTFAMTNGKVLVPESIGDLWYYTKNLGASDNSLAGRCQRASETKTVDSYVSALYAGVALLAQRMKSNEVFAILKVLGDVALIKQFANCFGKQKYSEFQAAATESAFDFKKYFPEGRNVDLVPADDAFTILDLLAILSEDDGNRFHPDHESFKYSRVSRGTVDAAEVLTEAEQTEIAALTAKAKTPNALRAVQARMDEIIAGKPAKLEFEESESPDGYPISNLTLNENRPNVSAMIRKTGTVDIRKVLTEEAKAANVPEIFNTAIFRNYTVIKDGIINISELPVSLTRIAHKELLQNGVVTESYEPGKIYVVNLRALPVINRKMVNEVSAERLFRLQYDLTKAKAAQKVFNHFYKGSGGTISKGYAELYGTPATEWLKSIGLTESSGFSPKRVQAESTDFYMGKELIVSLKGLKTIPGVNEVLKRQADKKPPTAVGALLVPALDEVAAFQNSKEYLASSDRDSLFRTWIEGKKKETTARVRELMRQMAEIKFSVVVGQVWFSEFSSLDEGTMTLKLDGINPVECTVEQKEIEIEI